MICHVWLISLGGFIFYEVKEEELYLRESGCLGKGLDIDEGAKSVFGMQYTRKNTK